MNVDAASKSTFKNRCREIQTKRIKEFILSLLFLFLETMKSSFRIDESIDFSCLLTVSREGVCARQSCLKRATYSSRLAPTMQHRSNHHSNQRLAEDNYFIHLTLNFMSTRNGRRCYFFFWGGRHVCFAVRKDQRELYEYMMRSDLREEVS